ncbi:MAG: TonB-dependent receptor [Alphaproteobacteria bacterium]
MFIGTSSIYRIALAIMLVTGFFVAGPVGAQGDEAPAEQNQEVVDRGKLETITVNVRYREERSQDTPMAVSPFDALALEDMVAQDIRDVAPATPNLHLVPVVTFPNSAAISIRGIGIQGIESTEEPRVGVSVDGVFIARPIATLIDLFDVESVEVLRGPQGISFGKNSLAGGLNVRSKRPTGDFGWHAEGTAGRFERYDFRGAVEFPIVEDKLAMRISGMSQNYGGHFRNRVNNERLNGENILSLRATTVWTPSDNFDLTLIGFWLRERSDAPGGDNAPDCSPGDAAFPQILCFLVNPTTGLPYSGEPDDDPYLVGRDAPENHDTDQWMVVAEANWDVGALILTSLFGYVDTDGLINSDFDQTEILFFPTFRDQTHYQLSEEFRIATDFSDMDGFISQLDMVLGLYYLEQKHELVQSFPTLNNSADYTTQKHEHIAGFGQIIWHATDRLNLNFGLRYSHEKKEFFRNPGTQFSPAEFMLVDFATGELFPENRPSIDFMATQMPSGGIPLVIGDISRDRVMFRAGADYRFNDQVMAYFQFSQGYKAGSFGARAASLVTAGPTDDETSDSYEVGIKSDLFDERVRLNITAFYTKLNDLEFGLFIPNPTNPTGQETLNDNIASARVQGIEIELTAKPHERVTLHASVGILDSDYKSFCADIDGPSFFDMAPASPCGGRVANLSDPGSTGAGTYLVDEDNSFLRLPRAPKLQLYFAIDYDHPLGNFGTLAARAAVTHSSGFFSEGTNNPKGFVSSYTTLDASLTWHNIDENVSVKVWGKNLTGELYLRGLTPTANFFNQRFWGERRTWGVTVSWRG